MLDLGLEGRAGRAHREVAADRGATQRAPLQRRELLADLLAAHGTRLPPPGQCLASLEDQRLHLVGPDVEGGRDLLLGEVAELGEHQRRALLVGQAGDVAQQILEVLAQLDRVREREAVAARLVHVVQRERLAPRPQHREAAVAGDRVEPGLEIDLRAPLAEMVVRGDEHALEGVLGLLVRAQHVAAEAQQRSVVAVIDRLERRLVTAPQGSDQPLIGGAAQQPRRQPQRARKACGGLHLLPIGLRRAELSRRLHTWT